MTNQPSEDIDLVRSALAGDRPSFEAIVRRYQTLVCSVAYSGTGNLALSEDVAQETFLTAWRTLGQLREPEKLRAWLCGIARRLAANSRRAKARTENTVPSVADSPCADSVDPAQQLISEEDRTLMWETLGQMPANYREPLILFYREQRSVRRVAEDLALSEDAVKQRLSRGRRMLTERIAARVEQALTQSKPGKAFGVAVMAALPAMAPQVAAAGVVVGSGKGTVVGKAALFGGSIAALLGPLLGLLGAWIGVSASIRTARSPAERKLMIRTGWIVFGYIALLNIFIAAAYTLPSVASMTTTVVVLVILSLIYVAGIIRIAVWVNRRQRQIRIEDGTERSPQAEWAELTTRKMVGSLAGSTVGSVAWIFSMAVLSGDWPTALVIVVVACGLLLPGLRIARQLPNRYFDVAIALTLALCVLNLTVVNLRWIHWVAFVGQADAPSNVWMPPLWALNLLLIGIFAMVVTALFYKRRDLHRRA